MNKPPKREAEENPMHRLRRDGTDSMCSLERKGREEERDEQNSAKEWHSREIEVRLPKDIPGHYDRNGQVPLNDFGELEPPLLHPLNSGTGSPPPG